MFGVGTTRRRAMKGAVTATALLAGVLTMTTSVSAVYPDVPAQPSLSDSNLSRRPGTAELSISTDPRGSMITGYRVTCTAPGESPVEQTFAESLMNNYVVTGLSTRKTVMCSAVATSDLGDSDPSEPLPFLPMSDQWFTGSMGQQIGLSTWAPTVFDEASRVTPPPAAPPQPLQLPEGLFEIAMYLEPTPGAGADWLNLNFNDLGASSPDYTGFVTYDAGSWSSLPFYSPGSSEPIPADGYVSFTGQGGVSLQIVDGGIYDIDRQVNGVVSLIGGPTIGSTTPPTGLPVPPKVTDVTVMEDYQVPLRVEVNFTPVGGFDPNNWVDYGDVTYTATCRASGGATRQASATWGPILVTGLSKGRAYSCTVTASNSSGTGPESDPSMPFTTPDVPVAGAGWSATSATRLSPTTAEVMPSFYEYNSMWPITRYRITCTGPGVPTVSKTFNTPNFEMGPFTITGLDSRGTYTCSDVATNALGDSAPSQPSFEMWPKYDLTVKGASGADVSLLGGIVDRFARVSTPANIPPGLEVPEGMFDIGIFSDNSVEQKTFSLSVWPANDEYTGFAVHRNGMWIHLRPGEPTAAGDSVSVMGSGSVMVTIVDGGAFDADGVRNEAVSLIGGPTTGQSTNPADVVGVADFYEVDQDVVLVETSPGVLSNDTGGAGQLSATLVSQSLHGTVSVSSDGGFEFEPAAGFGGLTSFTYSVSDGVSTSGPVTVQIFVRPAPPMVTGVTVMIDIANGEALVGFDPFDEVDPFGRPLYGMPDYTARCFSNDGHERTATNVSSPVSVGGLIPGTEYRCTVMATNQVRTGPPSAPSEPFTVAGAPGAPTGLRGVRLTPERADVLFTPPASDGGSSIFEYVVRCSSNDAPEVVVNFPGGSTVDVLVNLTGLSPSALYICRVVAWNMVGPSPASNALTLSALPSETIPGVGATFFAPSGSTITSLTASSTIPAPPPPGTYLPVGVFDFTIEDVAPGEAVSVIIDYPVQPGVDVTGYAKLRGGAWVQMPDHLVDTSTPGRITITIVDGGEFDDDGLVNGVVVDPGGPTAETSLTVPPQVTGVSVSPALTAEAVVSFDPVAAGYGTVVYDAVCASSTGGATRSSSAGSSPVTVEGLTSRSAYACTVTARNEVGPGAASAPSATFTVPGLADPPRDVQIARFPDQIRVSYPLPFSDGGSTITGFTATCASPDAPTLTRTVGLPGSLTVTIQLFGPLDGATYDCSVVTTNGVGSTDPSSTITVLPPPPTVTGVTATRIGTGQISVAFDVPDDPLGRTSTFNPLCTVVGDGAGSGAVGAGSPIVVSGLSVGPSYQCTVRRSTGDSTSASYSAVSAPSNVVVTAVPPSPPTDLVGSRPTLTTALLSWGPPVDDGGSPVGGYTARCTSPSGAEASTATASSPVTLTGLTATATYSCTVTAGNSVGTSPASNVVILVGGAVPDAPTIVTSAVGFDDDRDALIRFTPPASDGGLPITSYEVTCTTVSGTPTHTGTATGTTSPVEVGGLLPYRSYRCRVTATNAAGTSAPSAQSAAFTTRREPGRPTDAHATPSASRQVSVAFTPPAYIGAAPITSYTLRCESSDGGVTVAGVRGTTNPMIGNGLTAGKTYTCRVSAQNRFGSSIGSEPSAPFVVTGLPGAPVDVAATAAGSTRATVTFLPPEDNTTFPATGYSVTCTSSDGGATRTIAGSASPITVTGLSAGRTYVCSVRATNGAGSSTAVSAAAVTLPLPPAPQEVSVTMTGTTASVAFTPGAANASDAVTTNTATCTSSTGGTTRSASRATSPITVTGLTSGATYTCTVTAKAGSLSGPPSDPSATFVVASTPDAPEGVTVTLGGNGLVALVRFTPPADGGSPVRSYSVTCTSTVSGVTTRTATGLTSPLVVTGLVAGTTYLCAVTARNTVGVGTARTEELTTLSAPMAPSGVDVELAGNTSPMAIVTFTPAPAGVGSQAVAWHRAICTPTGGGTVRSAQVVTGPAVVTGLTPGTAYSCVVAAGTAGGVLGTPSTAVTFTTN